MFPRNRLFVKLLIRYGCSFIFICFIFNYFGVLTHLFEENFYENFHYPYDGDVLSQCYLLRHGQKPEVEPINNQTYSCRHNNDRKCKDEFGQSPINPHLLIIVKSKNSHFDKRNAIRNSWGFERRFSDVVIRTIFTLGIDQDTHDGNPSEIQKLVDLEAERFQDIIQVRRQIVTDRAIFYICFLPVQLHRRIFQQHNQNRQRPAVVQRKLHQKQILPVCRRRFLHLCEEYPRVPAESQPLPRILRRLQRAAAKNQPKKPARSETK